jgi:hypothetical protein
LTQGPTAKLKQNGQVVKNIPPTEERHAPALKNRAIASGEKAQETATAHGAVAVTAHSAHRATVCQQVMIYHTHPLRLFFTVVKAYITTQL